MAVVAPTVLRILFPYLARVRSANWSRYHQLLAARARAGDSVRVLEPPPRPSAETNFQPADVRLPVGMEIEEVAVPPILWGWRRTPFDKIMKKGIYSLAANRRAREIVRRDRPDVLLVYNLTQSSLLSAGVTAAFDVADDLPQMLRREAGALGLPLAALGGWMLAHMARRADLVTTCSRKLQRALPVDSLLLPNGVDPAEIARARACARPEPRAFRVGFLGSFEYFVDFDLLLDTASRMPSVAFRLIGGGRELLAVRKKIEAQRLGNVETTGPLPHETALASLAECDISLCPFVRGPVGDAASPLKVFESLALGVAVVATPAAELVEEALPGVTFAATAAETAAEIQRIQEMTREARAAAMEAPRARVLSERSWDALGERWAQAVRAIPRHRPQKREP
jgi:glycosyltransferase involved in cell wall biosynthesis